MELTIEQLGDLATKAAEEGIRIGKAGTDGDHTDSGIAFEVLLGAGFFPELSASLKRGLSESAEGKTVRIEAVTRQHVDAGVVDAQEVEP